MSQTGVWLEPPSGVLTEARLLGLVGWRSTSRWKME